MVQTTNSFMLLWPALPFGFGLEPGSTRGDSLLGRTKRALLPSVGAAAGMSYGTVSETTRYSGTPLRYWPGSLQGVRQRF